MERRRARNGAEFWGCTHYPACRETAPVGLPGITCPRCAAPVVERRARKSGRPFWPCSRRECAFVAWEKPHRCQACGTACWGEDTKAGSAPPVSGIEATDDEVPF